MKEIFYFFAAFLLAFPAFAQDSFPVYFDFNVDVPNRSSTENLNDWIKSNKDAQVIKLSGYCDSIDKSGYNIELSSRRIQSVLGILRENGITIQESVELKPYGEDFTQLPQQELNRRVDIFFKVPSVEKTVADGKKREEIFDANMPEPSLEKQLSRAKIGDLIRISDINFYFNSEIVVPESEPKLLELYQSMAGNEKLSIEIHGHICCNPNINDTKLSFRRAKFIFDYLLKKGIPLNRLAYKGFGSARPVYRIPERNPQEKAANRRVEILIVKI